MKRTPRAMIAAQATSPTRRAVRWSITDTLYPNMARRQVHAEKPADTIGLMAEPARRPKHAAPAPGSAAWWSARAVPPPERGRGRPPRSFEDIVSVAADLVDELGVDGVNMRLLAERLGTGTATLYRHVAGKDELMVHVLDSRMGEIVRAYDAEGARPRTWREALERIAFAYRGFLVA